MPPFYFTVATTEILKLPPNYAHIHYLVSINVQQTSVNIKEAKNSFFCMNKFSDTPLLHIYCHVIQHFARLLSITILKKCY